VDKHAYRDSDLYAAFALSNNDKHSNPDSDSNTDLYGDRDSNVDSDEYLHSDADEYADSDADCHADIHLDRDPNGYSYANGYKHVHFNADEYAN